MPGCVPTYRSYSKVSLRSCGSLSLLSNHCALAGALFFCVLYLILMPSIQARALILAELARLKKAREFGRDKKQNLFTADA